MGDGSISFSDGLGSKAVDSYEKNRSLLLQIPQSIVNPVQIKTGLYNTPTKFVPLKSREPQSPSIHVPSSASTSLFQEDRSPWERDGSEQEGIGFVTLKTLDPQPPSSQDPRLASSNPVNPNPLQAESLSGKRDGYEADDVGTAGDSSPKPKHTNLLNNSRYSDPHPTNSYKAQNPVGVLGSLSHKTQTSSPARKLLEVFKQESVRVDSEERLAGLIDSVEADMEGSGVKIDCSELKTQLSQLKVAQLNSKAHGAVLSGDPMFMRASGQYILNSVFRFQASFCVSSPS